MIVNQVPESELAATVARMEANLARSSHEQVVRLFAHYHALVPRFEKDLGASSRDVLLARSAALMLIQATARADDASEDP